MAQFISIAQVKGGTGKSTLATQLAGALARTARVGLIDADMPQGTSSTWAALRNDPDILCLTCDSAPQLPALAEQLDEADCDFVIIDLPPRSLKFFRQVVPFSDLVLVPLAATAPDVWATERLIDELKAARKTSRRLKYRLVWNRLPSAAAAGSLRDETVAAYKARELGSVLQQRAAYADAIAQGATVLEGRNRSARRELEALLAEVLAQLRNAT